MRHRLLTSRPIIVVNLYDYEFQSLWLFVKAEKQSPNIILVYFSIIGVLFLSEKNFKARRPVLDPLPPTYSSQLCFLNTSWWLLIYLIYFQCYNLFSDTILVFPESLLIGPPLSLQCVLILRVNTDILNLNIRSCHAPPYSQELLVFSPNAFIGLQARPCILSGTCCFLKTSCSHPSVSLFSIPYTYCFLNREGLSFCHVTFAYNFLSIKSIFPSLYLFNFDFGLLWKFFPTFPACGQRLSPFLFECLANTTLWSHIKLCLFQPHLHIHGSSKEWKPSKLAPQLHFQPRWQYLKWSSFSTNIENIKFCQRCLGSEFRRQGEEEGTSFSWQCWREQEEARHQERL